MKETEFELSKAMAAELGADEAAELRGISEMIRGDMLRYSRILDAEEEANEN